MCEEIFGPILPALIVDSSDEATAFVKARPKPLAADGFTKSSRLGDGLSKASSGAVVVNQLAYQLVSPATTRPVVGDPTPG